MTTDSSCQRSLSRKRVLMNALVISAEGTQQARVHELTSLGARISVDRDLESGSDVIFKRGQTFVAARVVWAESGSAGIEFYRAMPAFQVAA